MMTDEEFTEEEKIYWLHEAFERLKEEIDCCLKHLEELEFSEISLHVSNIISGLNYTGQVVFDFLTMDQKMEIVRQLTELQTGTPMMIKELFPGIQIMMPEPIDVPDNLDDLNE